MYVWRLVLETRKKKAATARHCSAWRSRLRFCCSWLSFVPRFTTLEFSLDDTELGLWRLSARQSLCGKVLWKEAYFLWSGGMNTVKVYSETLFLFWVLIETDGVCFTENSVHAPATPSAVLLPEMQQRCEICIQAFIWSKLCVENVFYSWPEGRRLCDGTASSRQAVGGEHGLALASESMTGMHHLVQ